MVEAFLIKGLTHVPYQLFIYAGRLEMTHLANQGNIYHLVRGIKANTIELITKLTGNLKAGAYAVIVEIYQGYAADFRIYILIKQLSCLQAVTTAGCYQSVRNGASCLHAPRNSISWS